MTPGTSPHSLGTPSMGWTEIGKGLQRALVRLRQRWQALRPQGPRLARAVSILYLTGLGVVLTTAWHAPAVAGGNSIAGFPAWHLAFLMTMGAAGALLTIGGRYNADAVDQAGEPPADSTAGVSELMAQMSHELRTPLNAVIGFSDVMLRELHGPLGNARYQEYAHHISESGGRLLKSSEEALAVTEAMTVLMADRRPGRRERSVAATLLREGWQAASPTPAGAKQHLALTTCTTCDILCERRPTVQAVEHLFREALGRMPEEGTVEVTGRRQGGRRSLEIRTEGVGQGFNPHASLRVILARLLLEVQGARLTCRTDRDGAWIALIEFPGRG
jgi:signal transduction histidine kinase